MKNTNDYWSDYWQKDGAGGEVFVNQQGQRPSYIADYWAGQFESIADEARVIDVASGAGSIYEGLSLEQRTSLSLTAADISASALAILQERVAEANVVECSSSNLPFGDQSFDLLVSQFGVEYAGFDGFREAARLVAENGQLAMLCHYRDGYIDQRNKSFLEGAKIALESRYIETAIELTKAIFTGSKTKVRKLEKPFIAAQVILAKSLHQHPEGIHRHLYFGYREMYLKIQNYHQHQVIQWLLDMQVDIKKNIKKVSEIRKVSLSQKHIDQVKSMFEDQGLSCIEIKPLKIPDLDKIVAWSITARRTG